MLHSFQCLPVMETGYLSLTIHFEILMNKVKPSDLSLIFGGEFGHLSDWSISGWRCLEVGSLFSMNSGEYFQASHDLLRILSPTLLICQLLSFLRPMDLCGW